MGSSMATVASRVSVKIPLAFSSLITIMVAAGAVAAEIPPKSRDTAILCLNNKDMARTTTTKAPKASKRAIKKIPLPNLRRL